MAEMGRKSVTGQAIGRYRESPGDRGFPRLKCIRADIGMIAFQDIYHAYEWILSRPGSAALIRSQPVT